jgi:hypothetical protein
MRHLGQGYNPIDLIVWIIDLEHHQNGLWGVSETMHSLFLVVRRVQDQPEEPAPQDAISALGDPTVVLGISEIATHDQPQRAVNQLPPEVGEHVSRGGGAVVFHVKFVDRVRKLEEK